MAKASERIKKRREDNYKARKPKGAAAPGDTSKRVKINIRPETTK